MAAIGASHPEPERTEAELVHAVRRGDEQAFGELYERYGRRIFAYVLRMVRDFGRAEDLTQEVFISALRRMRDSERAISVKPWLYEIAKNACIDEARRRQRSQEVPIEQEDSGYRLPSREPSPDACFERGQRLAGLNAAFQGLSEQQHRVLALRELEGRSYSEIAAKLGMSVAIVESTLLRARRRLAYEYEDIASGRRCEQVHTVISGGGQRAVDALGVREGRRFARHVAQCQPCARYAWAAGITVPGPPVPGLVKKLAGLLPMPFAHWPWRGRAAGVLQGARRAAQALHPGASAGITPAAAATIAAVVLAGGGAALELFPPGKAPAHANRTLTVSAQVAAATSRSQDRSRTQPRSQAGATGQGNRSTHVRSGGAKTAGGAGGAHSSSPAKQGGSPKLPGTPSSPPSVPGSKPAVPSFPQLPHLPKAPQFPNLPSGKRLLHHLTKPVRKVLKKVLPGLGKVPPLLERQVSPLVERAASLLDNAESLPNHASPLVDRADSPLNRAERLLDGAAGP
jgi:RNA polymerase sigma factor (sigma-70 family)